MMAEVVYSKIKGYPGYLVGTDGTVWTSRDRKGRWIPKWRKLKITKDDKGYLRVTLSKNNKSKVFKIHRLLLLVFIGPCPPGMEGCHNDDNKLNNDLTNLRWDTPANNQADRIKNGKTCKGQKREKSTGENHYKRTLGIESVKEIRNLYNKQDNILSFDYIGKMYNVKGGTIRKIIKRETWKHVD